MTGELSNVIGLPVPEPERYVSRKGLAELMGVSVTTVDRWVTAGIPSETWGLRARRFRPSTAAAWVRSQATRPGVRLPDQPRSGEGA